MLVIAWVSAPLFTLPQTFNYQLTHPYAPLRPEFAQCRNNAYPYEKMVKTTKLQNSSPYKTLFLGIFGRILALLSLDGSSSGDDWQLPWHHHCPPQKVQ